MVTIEQILETERKCEEIRQKYEHRKLIENKIQFNSIEEAMKFYHCEPFEEFDKRFGSGE